MPRSICLNKSWGEGWPTRRPQKCRQKGVVVASGLLPEAWAQPRSRREMAEGVGKDDGELQLCPHAGRLLLDTVGPDTRVIHLETLEAVSLGEGAWELVFDGDGFCCALKTENGESVECVLYEDICKKVLWLGPDGRHWMQDRNSPNMRLVDLEARQREHEDITVSVVGGAPVTDIKVAGFLCTYPRGGCRFWWSAPQFYKLLGLQSFKGQRSRWVGRSARPWQRTMQPISGPTHHVLPSASEEASKVLGVEPKDRFLTETSFSSAALIAQLATWGSEQASRRHLKEESARICARMVLDALVKGMWTDRRWVVALKLCTEWKHGWPLREPDPDLTLRVYPGGIILINEWPQTWEGEASDAEKARVWNSWRRKAQRCMSPDDGYVIYLAQLLRATCYPEFQSFFGQLVFSVAMQLEYAAFSSLKLGVNVGGGLTCKRQDVLAILEDRSKLGAALTRILFAGRAASVGETCLSMQSDKSNVGGLSMMFANFGCPSGIAWIAAPRVQRATSLPTNVPKTRSEKLETIYNTNSQHVAWIKRQLVSGKAGWKAYKWWRKSAEKFVNEVDAFIMLNTEWTGLRELQYQPAEKAWSKEKWATWKHLLHVGDRGGDCLSGIMAVVHKLKCNVTPMFDWSHDTVHSFEDGVKKVGDYDMFLLFLIIINRAQGPDKDQDQRFKQFGEVWEHLFNFWSSETCVLFQRRAADMIREAGGLDHDSDESPTAALWRHLKEEAAHPRKEHKVKKCQYHIIVRKLKELIPVWSRELFLMEFLGLHEDYVSSKVFKASAITEGAAEHASELATTSSSATQVDTKMIKNSGQNVISICVHAMDLPDIKRSAAIMAWAGTPLAKAQGKAAAECKSMGANAGWHANLMGGAYMETLREHFAMLENPEAFEQCGFLVVGGAFEEDEDNVLEDIDNNFARKFGVMLLTVNAGHQRRTHYLILGWDYRTVLLTIPGREQNCIDKFKGHAENYDFFSALDPKPQCLKDMLARHAMNTVANLQWRFGFEQTGWTVSEPTTNLARKRKHKFVSSQLCEDEFRYGKNSGRLKGTKHLRCPDVVWGTLVGKKVHTDVHKYLEAPKLHKKIGKVKGSYPSDTLYGKKPLAPSLNTSGIKSRNPKASYFSPVAANASQPTFDLVALSDARLCDDVSLLDRLNLAAFNDPSHLMVFRRAKGRQAMRFAWHAPQFHMPNSASCIWPATLKSVPQYPSELYISFENPASEPKLVTLTSWADIEVREYKWLGWRAQSRTFPRALATWRPGVRALITSETMPLKQFAARNAFWQFDLAMIVIVAMHLGIALGAAKHVLLDALLVCIKSILGCDDVEAMDIIALRFRWISSQWAAASVLGDVDEASQVLEAADEEELRNEKKRARGNEESFLSFKQEFRRKRREVRAEEEKKLSADAKKKKMAKKHKIGGKLPDVWEHVTHAQAKLLLPPGAKIWRCNTGSGAWCSVLEPHASCSRSWQKYGPQDAMKRAISHAWRCYCDLEGYEYDASPMKGIYTTHDD